jgi:hypothetical protein
MQEFHRLLFANSADSLRQDIKRITGMEVREATTEIEPASGAVVQAFTTGTVVQVPTGDHGTVTVARRAE